MSNINLQLQTGVDIPCVEIGLGIHQPSIKEIAYIGEENFFMGCELLTFSKKKLSLREQQRLAQFSDFVILMSMLNHEDVSEDALNAFMVLTLLFPNATIKFEYDKISLVVVEDEEEIEKQINEKNFQAFKDILFQIFMLDRNKESEYKASGAKAQELIDKFKKRQQLLTRNKKDEELDIIGRYVSILAVGEQKDKNMLINYTMYQLFDEFERFMRKYNYDIYISSKLSFGGSNADEPDSWTDSLQNTKEHKNE